MLYDFNDDQFFVTPRAYSLEGCSFFVEVDSGIDVAALESDADEVILGHDLCPCGWYADKSSGFVLFLQVK